MKIFFDFDDTLFDTTYVYGKFGADLRAIMQTGGWTQEQITETKKEFFSASAFDPGQVYHYRHHMEILEEKYPHGLFEETLKKADAFMQDLQRYVFSDVVPTLEKLRKEDVIVISYGDDEFQRKKVSASGIEKYVSEVIIVERKPKLEIIGEWLEAHDIQGEEVFFVDDKVRYFEATTKNGYTVTNILMDRSGILEKGMADYQVKNMSEVEKIILKA